MISKEQLDEWERSTLCGERLFVHEAAALIAEVRRLRLALDLADQAALMHKAFAQDAIRERDAMRAVVASVRDGLDKIADGACDPPMTSYGTGCSGRCKYIAEAALAKLDEAKGEVPRG